LHLEQSSCSSEQLLMIVLWPIGAAPLSFFHWRRFVLVKFHRMWEVVLEMLSFPHSRDHNHPSGRKDLQTVVLSSMQTMYSYLPSVPRGIRKECLAPRPLAHMPLSILLGTVLHTVLKTSLFITTSVVSNVRVAGEPPCRRVPPQISFSGHFVRK